MDLVKLNIILVTLMRKLKHQLICCSLNKNLFLNATRYKDLCFIFVQISKMLVEKCIDNRLEEISETEFVRICSVDSEVGTVVIQIFRAFIGCWSFVYERWSSGMFFTQTKPPTGQII